MARVTDLAEQRCIPCTTGRVPKLPPSKIKPLARQVPRWKVVSGRRLRRAYKTKDFAASLALVEKVSALAEKEYHHPELRFGWGHVEIEWWTHAADGLTENDFIMAAKTDRVLKR